MSKVLVRLKAGHPTGTMYARLSDGSVVTVQSGGVVVDADQVNESMTIHGRFEITPVGKAAKADSDGDSGAPAVKLEPKDLEAMSMPELREIGNRLGVKDNKKDELIGKILAASK